METNINLGNLTNVDEWKKKNFMERLSFVKYWAEYVKGHDDRLWSKQQKMLIDSQLINSKEVYEHLLKTKGGREKISPSKNGSARECSSGAHVWGLLEGDVELREFTFSPERDMRAFMAAKILWEWEYDFWLRKVGYR